MCPQQQHTRKHAIHIYHNSSQRRVWGRRERVNRVNVGKIVSRCARGNLRSLKGRGGLYCLQILLETQVLPYNAETN